MRDYFYVYILASRYRGTLYVGVTNDLSRRVGEHKGGVVPGFTRRYKIDKLVYYEEFESILAAAHVSASSSAGAGNGSSS